MEPNIGMLASNAPEPDGKIGQNEAKLLAIVVLGFGSFLCGVLPIYISQRNRQRYPGTLSFLLCFGAGVLLATAIVHMLPEIRSSLGEYAEIVFCVGFFLMYAIDELVEFCGIGGHDHGGEERQEQERSTPYCGGEESDAASSSSRRERRYGAYDETKSLLGGNDPEATVTRRSMENLVGLVGNVSRRSSTNVPPSVGRPSQQSAAELQLTGVFGLLLALCMHSLLEGLAIGVQNSGPKVLLLLGAVSAHKFVVGFALGVQLCANGARERCSHVLQVLTFSLGSVAGIGVGMGLDGLNETLTTLIMPILQGLAGGTLLYVTVSEVLPRERAKRRLHARGLGPIQFVAVALGFGLMSALSLLLTDEMHWHTVPVLVVIAIGLAVGGVTGIYVVESGGKKSFIQLGAHHWTDGAAEDGLWSSLLEEYTVGLNRSGTASASRESRVMQATVLAAPAPKYIPTSSFYINKRIGEALELDPQQQQPQHQHQQQHQPHRVPPPVGKVIASTGAGGLYGDNHLPGAGHGATFTPMRQTFGGGASPTELLASPREVSETDLYLLGAIEKLVYRVDYMENRLRRAEQIIYFLMAGNSQKQEPCPQNFTQVHDRCYHFDIERGLNWKSASTMCKSYGAHLAEFETVAEFQDVVAYILNNPVNRGKDFWLGGLNPGLLWIWANSAKPVNPNTNLSSITTSSKPDKGTAGSSTPTKTANLGNGTDTSAAGTKIVNKPTANKQQPTLEITGSGRCLRLSYNSALYTYGYRGEDCSAQFSYVCELKDKSLDNEISRIAKQLKLADDVS
uniref:C-type lectin domain-containing protein n=1 Tax=Anopheles epiroticus TaxID=199890 RepID=A0A182PI61_9DIPT